MSRSPPRSSDYVELRTRSSFSFLEGASNPEDLVECAAQFGYPALALGDRNGVYGIPRFHQAAAAAGVRAIPAAEICLDAADEADTRAAGKRSQPAPSLLLLVESPAGWRSLCRLLTLSRSGSSPRFQMRALPCAVAPGESKPKSSSGGSKATGG